MWCASQGQTVQKPTSTSESRKGGSSIELAAKHKSKSYTWKVHQRQTTSGCCTNKLKHFQLKVQLKVPQRNFKYLLMSSPDQTLRWLSMWKKTNADIFKGEGLHLKRHYRLLFLSIHILLAFAKLSREKNIISSTSSSIYQMNCTLKVPVSVKTDPRWLAQLFTL